MTKLFATGSYDPTSEHYRNEDVIEDQGGSASAYLRPAAAPVVSSYLTGGVAVPPPAESRPRQTYTEEKSVRIKREYPIDVFAGMHLIGGRTRGKVALYVCPWHDDTADSPNLEVYGPGHPRYGHCKCWRCGGGGSVIDLAMQVFNTASPGEAMNLIEGKSQFDEARRAEYAERAERLAAIDAHKPELNPQAHIMNLVEWAHGRIQQDDAATRYLVSRGLGGAINLLLLGSSRGMPDSVLPQNWDGETGKVYPMRSFRDRIVIPYLKPDATVSYVNGRGIGEVDKKKKYRKPADVTPEPYMLDIALGVSAGDIVLTEGEFDAISLILALGRDPVGVFAVPGLHCFGEQDAAKLAGRRVFICTDADGAGDEGRQSLEDMIYGYAKEIHHIKVENGYNDVNDMLTGAGGRRNLRGWFMACVQKAMQPARKRFI